GSGRGRGGGANAETAAEHQGNESDSHERLPGNAGPILPWAYECRTDPTRVGGRAFAEPARRVRSADQRSLQLTRAIWISAVSSPAAFGAPNFTVAFQGLPSVPENVQRLVPAPAPGAFVHLPFSSACSMWLVNPAAGPLGVPRITRSHRRVSPSMRSTCHVPWPSRPSSGI